MIDLLIIIVLLELAVVILFSMIGCAIYFVYLIKIIYEGVRGGKEA